MTGLSIPLSDQIAEVERELAMRHRVYPSWIKAGRMSAAAAERQVLRLEAALATLRAVAEGR